MPSWVVAILPVDSGRPVTILSPNDSFCAFRVKGNGLQEQAKAERGRRCLQRPVLSSGGPLYLWRSREMTSRLAKKTERAQRQLSSFPLRNLARLSKFVWAILESPRPDLVATLVPWNLPGKCLFLRTASTNASVVGPRKRSNDDAAGALRARRVFPSEKLFRSDQTNGVTPSLTNTRYSSKIWPRTQMWRDRGRFSAPATIAHQEPTPGLIALPIRTSLCWTCLYRFPD
jgi:hypothetical protein